ncbi:MAG: hypothetical protein CM15mV81_350 [uncultured marine virus]|nr:MAG: hypothetical protein CM15mV81_350 [uncultured marine virus]
MTDETFYYCKEILKQIQYADPNAMNCWGVIVGHNCFALPETKELELVSKWRPMDSYTKVVSISI